MWLMNLNYDKCKCMLLSNCTFPTSQYLMSTGEECISVNQVGEQSDLGVLFTSNFKFGTHIHHIVQKTNGLITLLKNHSNFYVMNFIHKFGSSSFGLWLCGLVPISIGRHQNYSKGVRLRLF